MVTSANGRQLIVGVDRLDYSKGVEERFLGYERFLASHASRAGEVFLLQNAPPSRGEVQSYQELRASPESLSGRIHGAFAHVDWSSDERRVGKECVNTRGSLGWAAH